MDAAAEMTVEDMDSLFSFHSETYTSINSEIRKLELEIKALNQALKKLKQDPIIKPILPTPTSAWRREVHISIFAKPGELVLDLSYLVRDAKWSATYDIRVDTKARTCQLAYYGLIVNNTTENWQDANLVLSTAAPQLGGNPPELTVSRVKFKSPMMFGGPARNLSLMPSSSREYEKDKMEEAKEDAAESSDEEEQEVEVLTSTVEKGAFSATFKIPRRCSIVSDGKPHKVTITFLELEPEFTYIAIPMLSDRVYLKTKCENSSEFQLLPGPLNVFMDNYFVTTSSLPATAPSAKLDVSLGVDAGIELKFVTPDQNKTGKSGVIKKANTSETLHIITITNNKGFKVNITVQDQIPQATDQSIKVKVLEPDIKENGPVTYTANKNVEWKIDLKEGEKRTLKLHYQVEWPKDKEIEYRIV
eukprot:TRINITY_DN6904_c0_g1_i1.p1 TRINITY_DN6904_c0_g1~~TRINITY_DN6904_c0_g1_i1.p1  ORF type:complete len:474 (-),score=89.17 TRINITY_DN6904_c0_g1_i1:46-1299(-)